MAYVKQTWENLPSKTTPITAARLAHMETQYDNAISVATNTFPSKGEMSALEGRVSEIAGLRSGNRKLEAVFDCPAVPATGYWPSGFKYDPVNPNVVYVFYEGPNTLKIRSYNLATGAIILERNVAGQPTISSTENSMVWRNASGDTMMVLRVTSGANYHVYNFTKNTLNPVTPIQGLYKMAEHGNSVFTCDAAHNNGGVGRIYEYDRDSVMAGTPSLIREYDLQYRNMYEKSQGMSVSQNLLYFALGRSNFVPGLSVYSRSGHHIESYEFETVGFAEMALSKYPNIPIDKNSWKHETEGSDVMGEVLFTGHILRGDVLAQSRFVIVKHGSGVDVPVTPVANVTRNTMPIENFTKDASVRFTAAPEITRDSDTVYVGLEFLAEAAITGTQQLGVIGQGYRPRLSFRGLGRGTVATFNITVTPSGILRIDNLSATIPKDAWIPVFLSYRGSNGPVA